MAHERGFRVLSWNIHHGVGIDGRYDLDRVIREIEAAEPDVICLQEVDDRFADRTEGDAQPEGMADRLGMDYAIAHALPSRLDTEGGYGNVVLVDSAIETADTVALGPEPDDGGEPRALLATTLVIDATSVRVWCTHLDHAAAEHRAAQISVLERRMRTVGRPAVLAGDLNATAGATELSPLRERLRDPFDDPDDPATFPAPAPERRIDHLLVDPRRIRVTAATVLETAASDHRPVVADLVLTR